MEKKQTPVQEKFKTMIGGQALIEGILMRGPEKQAIVVRSPEGAVSMDATGRKPGRGAYVCRSAECLKRAIKQKQLERAFECPLGEDTHQALLGELEALEERP